jgi:uncharacterized protein YggE
MFPRRSLRAVLLAASLLVPAAAALADQSPPTLTVSGDGSATAAPNVAVVSLGVVSEAATAKLALSANSESMNAAIAAIVETGVAKKDIGTSGLSVAPIYSDPDKDTGAVRVTGYRVENQVTVKIRDIAGSGLLLDKVIGAGANRVNGISFEIDKAGALRDQATRAAITEAQRKAALIADAAGVKLGPIQSINTSDGGGAQPMFRGQMAMKMDAMPAPAPVMPGEQEISANATIVYTILPR